MYNQKWTKNDIFAFCNTMQQSGFDPHQVSILHDGLDHPLGQILRGLDPHTPLLYKGMPEKDSFIEEAYAAIANELMAGSNEERIIKYVVWRWQVLDEKKIEEVLKNKEKVISNDSLNSFKEIFLFYEENFREEVTLEREFEKISN